MLTAMVEDYYVDNKGGGLLSEQQRRSTKLTTKVEDY